MTEWAPEKMESCRVPAHLRDGLRRYVENGIPPGDGLRRVLEDAPFSEVIVGLDAEARDGAADLVKFLYNYAPAASWGSRQIVSAWIAHRGLGGAK